MAGTMAGLAAREAGAEVTLVMAGPGASALSSGVLDVAWHEARPAGSGHPLDVLRESLPSSPEVLAQAASWLGRLFGEPAGNGRFATLLGTIRGAGLVQHAQARGKLQAGKHHAVVGFQLLPALVDAELVAQSLSAAGFPATACRVDYLDRDADVALTPFDLAARLDRAEEVERLASALARALPPGCDRVLMPPVLGLDHPDVASRLSAKVGVLCAELLPTVPSVPGLRLARALETARKQAAVRVVEGTLGGIREGRAEMVSGEVLTFDAAVLATGRFIGGGIARHARTVERLVGLPVSDGRIPLPDDSGPGAMAGAELGAAAALFRAGVEVDGSLHALDVERRPINWLLAAGEVLAGADGAVDGTGLGFAAFTGWLAGRNAAGGGRLATEERAVD
jgi:glycerol-3-phosphate dehydrogenase subunit B